MSQRRASPSVSFDRDAAPPLMTTSTRRRPMGRYITKRNFASGAIVLVFFTMLIFESAMLPGTLLSLPVAKAAPVGNSAPDTYAATTAPAVVPPAVRPQTASPPNITVVMPCFGQSIYLEEGLRSVLAQTYPPVEIIVVDDGSEDKCGEVAQRLLDGPLAALRRRAARQLQQWWGWSVADMARFRDEIVVTPNRGVAHARNTGVRRARGDWIMCMDADDTVSDSYFLTAMTHVATDPGTNLVYANQQFFGESRWQWHVPELRADNALVNGPLPLMTLWRRSLWKATPHGFDEASAHHGAHQLGLTHARSRRVLPAPSLLPDTPSRPRGCPPAPRVAARHRACVRASHRFSP